MTQTPTQNADRLNLDELHDHSIDCNENNNVKENEINELESVPKFDKWEDECEIKMEKAHLNCSDDFLRKAQTMRRKKDLYLKLVNIAIYGNFDKYYEDSVSYNAAAEHFALFGCGDLLDFTFQFNICNNKTNRELENDKKSIYIKPKNMGDSLNRISDHNNEKSFSENILHYIHPTISNSNALCPKTSNLISSHQILMQLNQPINMILSYPTASLMQYYFTPIWPTKSIPYITPAAIAYLNETSIIQQQHINTSIIQQQQQYNFLGGAVPYGMQYLGIYYAQLLQRSQQITQNLSVNNKLFGQH